MTLVGQERNSGSLLARPCSGRQILFFEALVEQRVHPLAEADIADISSKRAWMLGRYDCDAMEPLEVA